MQRFKVYEDTENVVADVKSRLRERKRQALGEIKNTIITRSRYSELNKGLKGTWITEEPKQKSKVPKRTKKEIAKRSESEDEKKVSPQITRRRRLSGLFRVSEYANDINKYLQKMEEKYPISDPGKMKDAFGEKTRFALVDWLVQVNEHFQFIHETFQLCVSIIDRYVQEQDSLKRDDLKLIAPTAIFIASKYEELIPVELVDLKHVCSCSSPIEEILELEMKIATELQFSFGRPVPAHFVRRYSNVANATVVEQSCAFYLTDVALMSYELCHIRPSILAASALYIALCVSKGYVDKRLWNPTLIKYSTYRIEDFESYTRLLAECLKKIKSSKYQAIEEKYSKPMHFNVSQIPELLTVLNILIS